jgi:hypothetical protein
MSEHDPTALHVEVTADDIESARLAGASGTELIEATIHTALDRKGIPREGRTVEVTPGDRGHRAAARLDDGGA